MSHFSGGQHGYSPKAAATDANIEEHILSDNNPRIEVVNSKYKVDDINGNRDQDRPQSPEQYITARSMQEPQVAIPEPVASLKHKKSAENVVQKHILEQSQKSDCRSASKSPQHGGGIEHVTLDPKLQLLDNQLRHILKHDGSDSSDRLKKQKAEEEQVDNTRTGVMHRSLDFVIEKDAVDSGMGPQMTKSLERHELINKPLPGLRHSTEMKDASNNFAIRFEKVSREDGGQDEMLVLECSKDHLQRKLEIQQGDSAVEFDVEPHATDRMVVGSAQDLAARNITFGGVDEKSYNTYMYTHAVMGDEPTQAGEQATRAAPCTVVTQFNLSMASSEEESDGEDSVKGDSPLNKGLSSQIFSPYSEHKRGTMMKQLQDVSERISEKLNAREIGKGHSRRELFQDLSHKENSRVGSEKDSEADSFGANSRSAHKDPQSSEYRPVKSILEEIPRPKYSSHSPGSPAKFSPSLAKPGPSPIKALPVLSRVKEDSKEFRDSSGGYSEKSCRSKEIKQDRMEDGMSLQAGVVHELKQAGKVAATDEMSGSDTEASRNVLDKEVIREKLMALKLEERGVADGESPRQNSGDEEVDKELKKECHINKKASVLFVEEKEVESLLTIEKGPIISVPFSPIITRVPDVVVNTASLDRGPLSFLSEDMPRHLSPLKDPSSVQTNLTKDISNGVLKEKEDSSDNHKASRPVLIADSSKSNGQVNSLQDNLNGQYSNNKKELSNGVHCVKDPHVSGHSNETVVNKDKPVKSSKVPNDSISTMRDKNHKSRLPVRDNRVAKSENGERALPPSPKKSSDGPRKSETVLKKEKSLMLKNQREVLQKVMQVPLDQKVFLKELL